MIYKLIILKEILIVTYIILLLISCKSAEAVKWLNIHDKPIYVYSKHYDKKTLPYFTFIDKHGEVYFAGEIKLSLPDSITRKQ